MKILITGITGFAGSHLAELGLAKNAEVYGIKRWRSRMDNIKHLTDKVRLLECDITDYVHIQCSRGGEAGLHIPPRGAELRAHIVERPGRNH